MSVVYLTRHADAGDPWEYPRDDTKRGLSRIGKHQADEMGLALRGKEIVRIHTSSAERCQETAQHFHRKLHVPVVVDAMLAPASGNMITAAMRTFPQETAVVCTHSDNIYAFLKTIHEEDDVVVPSRITVPCGSFYMVERAAALFTKITYIAPGAPIPAPPEPSDAEWVE